MSLKNTVNKYSALIGTSVATILLVILSITTPIGSLEVFLFLLYSFFGLLGLTGFLDGGWKNISKPNLITYIILVLISLFFFTHMSSLEEEHTVLKSEYTIEETNEFFLFKSKNHKLLYFEKENVKYDEDNSLKVYEFYTTDIFGLKMLSSLKVKSGLMNDYVNIKVLEHRKQ